MPISVLSIILLTFSLWGKDIVSTTTSPTAKSEGPTSASPTVPVTAGATESTSAAPSQELASPSKTQLITAPVFINEIEKGQVQVTDFEGPEEDVAADGPKLIELMVWDANEAVLEKARSYVRGTGLIRIKELRALGLTASFTPADLSIKLSIPANLRKQQDLDFYVNLPAKEYIGPSWFSGYTNLYMSRLFDSDQLTGKKDANFSDPTLGRVEQVFNFGGVALDMRGTYTEHADYPWMRGNFRLIKDYEPKAMRWMVGDFEFPLDMFQNSVSLGGVLVFKEYSIDPFLVPFPQSETEFFLDTPSRVEVFINGRFMQTLYLPAGRHNIRNLPIQQGANEVKLLVTDQFGKTQTLIFPFITDFELLDRSLHRFAYAYGRKKTLDGGNFEYGDNAASFFHQYGLTKNITIGANGQGDDFQKVYGARIYYGTPYGLFGLNWAQSNSELNGTGNAYAFRYRTISDYRSIFRLQITQMNQNYGALGITNPNNIFDRSAQLGWTKYLSDSLSMSLGGTYEFHRDSLGDRRTYFALLTKRFTHNMDGSLQYSEFRDPVNSNGDRRLFVTLQWIDGSFNNSFFASHDTQFNTSQLLWSHNPGRDVGRNIAHALYNENPTTRTYQAGLGYIGYRGILEMEQRHQTDKDEVLPNRNLTRLAASTSLAYTKNGIGFTRPVAEAFALVKPTGALKDHYVEVNPTSKNPRAIADKWGPAIIPDMQSYYADTLYLQTPDPLASSLFSQNTFRVRPTYKSGVGITVAGNLAVMLSGRLVPRNPKSPPWSLKTGILTPLAGGDKKAIEFFTNKTGEFYAESVAPGEYELQLDDQSTKYKFQVPEKMGPHDLGVIKY